MVAMKHVGLNVAADVFMNLAKPVASDLLHIGKADIISPMPC
jgi:TPP-dependent indolepyruvate ferredoxin oxidoreductase alpha subunit